MCWREDFGLIVVVRIPDDIKEFLTKLQGSTMQDMLTKNFLSVSRIHYATEHITKDEVFQAT